jgi:hypothetical protein
LHYYSCTNGGRADKLGNNDSRSIRRKIVADTVRGKITEAGNVVAEAAKKVGNRIDEKAEEAKDWAKEKLHKAQNRADEAGQKGNNAAEASQEDEKAKGCGCE